MFANSFISAPAVGLKNYNYQPRRNFIKIIQQGKEGQRLTLGRDPVRLEPGLWIKIPIIHSIKVVDMREGSISIPSLNAYTKDNVPTVLTGTLFYRVESSERACFEVQDYFDSIKNLGTSAARSVIGKFEYDEINGDRNQINKELTETIGQQSDPWGVACTRFEIQDFKPQSEHIMRQLELQMEAERKKRENDLNTQAVVRTAEGQRDTTVLKSQGDLISSTNAAEATFIQAQKDADGVKYRFFAEAEGKSVELERLTKAFNGDVNAAAKFLIESNQIEQLKAIAEGKNNTTFFIPSGLEKLLQNLALNK